MPMGTAAPGAISRAGQEPHAAADHLLWGHQENSEAASENPLCTPSHAQKHHNLALNSFLALYPAATGAARLIPAEPPALGPMLKG